MQRTATLDAMERYFDENEYLKEQKIMIVPSNPKFNIQKAEHTPIANLHRQYLQNLASANENMNKCLHCDKILDLEVSALIEVDDLYSNPAVGGVHKTCLRPVDRIIGIVQPTVKKGKLPYNFDFKTWAKLLHRGQMFMYGLETIIGLSSQSVFAWTAEERAFRDYSYCMAFELSNGYTRYMKTRKKIHRFTKNQANDKLSQYQNMIHDFKKANNPLGYTSKNYAFGRKSELLKVKKHDEKIIEVKSVRVERYSKLLEKIDENANFYAPICLLRMTESDEEILLNDYIIPLITNPESLQEIIYSWINIGFYISFEKIHIKIIESDLEFDYYMRRFFRQNLTPILNPKFDKNRVLVSGIEIVCKEKMILDNIFNEGL